MSIEYPIAECSFLPRYDTVAKQWSTEDLEVYFNGLYVATYHVDVLHDAGLTAFYDYGIIKGLRWAEACRGLLAIIFGNGTTMQPTLPEPYATFVETVKAMEPYDR